MSVVAPTVRDARQAAQFVHGLRLASGRSLTLAEVRTTWQQGGVGTPQQQLSTLRLFNPSDSSRHGPRTGIGAWWQDSGMLSRFGFAGGGTIAGSGPAGPAEDEGGGAAVPPVDKTPHIDNPCDCWWYKHDYTDEGKIVQDGVSCEGEGVVEFDGWKYDSASGKCVYNWKCKKKTGNCGCSEVTGWDDREHDDTCHPAGYLGEEKTPFVCFQKSNGKCHCWVLCESWDGGDQEWVESISAEKEPCTTDSGYTYTEHNNALPPEDPCDDGIPDVDPFSGGGGSGRGGGDGDGGGGSAPAEPHNNDPGGIDSLMAHKCMLKHGPITPSSDPVNWQRCEDYCRAEHPTTPCPISCFVTYDAKFRDCVVKASCSTCDEVPFADPMEG